MALLGVEEGVDEEGVEEGAGGLNAVAVEDVEVELEVVTNLFGGFGEEAFEGGVVDAVVGEVVGGAGLEGEGDAEDVGLEAVEGGGLEVEAVAVGLFEGGEEVFLEGGGVDEDVVGFGVGDGFEGGI